MDLTNYDAPRSGLGLIERAERGRILVEGADRLSLLQGLLTNDMASLAAGSGVYSAWLTPQGRMIADLHVVELGEAALLDVPVELTRALRDRLDDSIFAEDVTVHDATNEWSHFAIAGPAAPEALDRTRAIPFVRLPTAGPKVPLFEVYARATDAPRLREALAAAGAVPVGTDAAESFRIESGIPRWGVDLDQDTIPLEAGLEDRAISFTKGCYVGQEVIVRVLHRGHGRVARRLVGLALPDAAVERLPTRGEPVMAEGKPVGELRSVGWSSRLRQCVALAYVRREALEQGAKLATSVGPAVVTTAVDR
jgi:folate-binding protein YgfZ